MIKIVYILGDGRSGSTLLDAILSNTPNSISIGEGYRFWKRFYEADTLCSCNEKIASCELWQKVDSELKAQIPNYDPVDTWDKIQFLLKFKNVGRISKIIAEPSWSDFKKTVRLFYSCIAHISNRNNIIDSSKSVGWLYLMQALDIQQVRVIHLERNLQAVSNSWKKQMRLPEYYSKEVFMPTRSTSLTVKTWLKVKYLSKGITKKLPSIFVKYEELVSQPESSLQQISDFIGLSIPQDQLLYVQGHSIGGNPMRKKGSGTISIQKKKEKFTNLNPVEQFFLRIINWFSTFIL